MVVEKVLKKSDGNTKAVVRSSSYPAVTILNSVAFTNKIYAEFGGGGYHSRESIAKVLKKSVSALIIPLSCAVQYGLIDMKTKVGYKPTDLFVSIYKPVDEKEKEEAMLECLTTSKLYSSLIETYKNDRIPSVTALSTTLFRKFNIGENASDRAADVFIENLRDLGLIDEENRLNFKNASSLRHDNDDTEDNNELDIVAEEYERNLPVTIRKATSNSVSIMETEVEDELPMHIKLSDGKKAKLIYPQDITNDDWDKIVRVIAAMKE